MNLSKIFLINFCLFFAAFASFSQEDITQRGEIVSVGDASSDASSDVVVKDPNRTEYYRSNSNGLKLVEIDRGESEKYKFVLQIDFADNMQISRTLYRQNAPIKQWTYEYANGILSSECYFKDGILIQQYFYDRLGHKIQEDDYKNSEIIKSTSFQYNREGLVSIEKSESKISNQITETRYRYDNLFRIKQISRTYPDGRVVYWEAFLSDKGIITKEYYTLKDEVYTFWYNKFGQETVGEIKQIEEVDAPPESEAGDKDGKQDKKTETAKKDDKKDGKAEPKKVKQERVKFKWENFYISKGLREQKIEENYDLNKKVITNYNKDGKETKIQTYYDDAIAKIEYYDYDDDKHIIYYKIIEDLTKNESFYRYNEAGNLSYTKLVENDKVKREINYFEDGSREETVFTSRGARITKKYNADGDLVK